MMNMIAHQFFFLMVIHAHLLPYSLTTCVIPMKHCPRRIAILGSSFEMDFPICQVRLVLDEKSIDMVGVVNGYQAHIQDIIEKLHTVFSHEEKTMLYCNNCSCL